MKVSQLLPLVPPKGRLTIKALGGRAEIHVLRLNRKRLAVQNTNFSVWELNQSILNAIEARIRNVKHSETPAHYLPGNKPYNWRHRFVECSHFMPHFAALRIYAAGKGWPL